MTLGTIAKYLLFDREAILAVATNRRAPWLGLFFVLGAGLAREYDKEYLGAEPWHALLPLGASLGACLVLYVVLSLSIFFRRDGRPGVFAFFPRFLGLFWMTAPLAWSYAIPYEQFLSEGDAAKANLITLGIVAAWRVALTVRVVSVVYGVGLWTAFWPVMFFAVGAAFAAVSQLDARLFALMGGVRLNEAEQVLQSAVFMLMIGAVYTSWIWILGALFVSGNNLAKPRPFPALPELTSATGRGPWILGGAVCVVLLSALAFTQGSQAKRHQVERLLAAGEYDAGLELMCSTPQDAFPRHWEPPPRDGAPDGTYLPVRHPDLLEITSRLAKREDVPEWALKGYTLSLVSLAFHSLGPFDRKVERLPLLLNTMLAWPDEELFESRVVSRVSEQLEVWQEPELAEQRKAEIALLEKVLARAKAIGGK